MSGETIAPNRAWELIDQLLSNHNHRMSEDTVEAFTGMAAREHLTPKQCRWVQDVAARLGLIDETSQNLWSGKSPAEQARIRGREVPTPAVLLNRPLVPPGRIKR